MHREKEMRTIRAFRESTKGLMLEHISGQLLIEWSHFSAIFQKLSHFQLTKLLNAFLLLIMIFSHSLALWLSLFLSFIHSCSASLIFCSKRCRNPFFVCVCVMQKLLSLNSDTFHSHLMKLDLPSKVSF